MRIVKIVVQLDVIKTDVQLFSTIVFCTEHQF